MVHGKGVALTLIFRLFLMVILLSSCTQTQINTAEVSFSRGTASDNYRFLEKEYETLKPGVEFVLMRNQEEYNTVMKKHFGRDWKKISAFTFWDKQKATCKIYIKDPAWSYEPEYIGHEVAHCIWGRFHRGREGQGPVIDNWKNK